MCALPATSPGGGPVYTEEAGNGEKESKKVLVQKQNIEGVRIVVLNLPTATL